MNLFSNHKFLFIFIHSAAFGCKQIYLPNCHSVPERDPVPG